MHVSRSKLLGVSAATVGAAWVHRARHHARRMAIPLRVRRPLPPGEPRRVAVVYNPSKAGAVPAVQKIERIIAAYGWEPPVLRATRVDEPGSEAAVQAVENGANTIIAVGGDGTMRAVATALRGSRARLGIIPLGTGNLLARNLDLPVGDITPCINIALNGTPQPVDAIDMITYAEDRTASEHNFFVMSGAGFDALVMNDTNEQLKARIGWLAYVQAGARHMFGHVHPVRITLDGRPEFETRMRSVLIANCGRLQGGLQLADMTDISDGNLEVIVSSPRTLLEWGMLVSKIMRRTVLGTPRIALPVIRHFVATSVRIEFLDGAHPVEVDGDPAPDAVRIDARVAPAVISINVHPDAL